MKSGVKSGKRKNKTHVDGSGRLQTVTVSQNPRYYNLIKEFGKITGVPIVLNTSFNENEPVVCKPGEALACFLRTKMDVLVMGDYFLRREEKDILTHPPNKLADRKPQSTLRKKLK